MKTYIAANGPLVTAFIIYSDFYNYKKGVYRPSSSATPGVGHAVSVVGYNDNTGAWRCINSWGTGWGDHGFFDIAYGVCGIDDFMWAVDGVVRKSS
jgi:C1A family cysteine protease